MFIWCILSGMFILFLAALCLMTGFKKGIDEKNTENAAVKLGCIRGIDGEYRGREFSIHAGDEIRIGRIGRENDLVLDSYGIEEKHCVIVYEENTEKYLVKNVSERGVCRLASGILLKKEESTVLEEGDLIDLGESQIFQVGERKVDENHIR